MIKKTRTKRRDKIKWDTNSARNNKKLRISIHIFRRFSAKNPKIPEQKILQKIDWGLKPTFAKWTILVKIGN